jgi:predicted phosphodiesterase
MPGSSLVEIDGPSLIFGGPYSNLQATSAVLAEARRIGVPPDRIFCTGDLIAYCGDPAATIDLVRGAGIHVVMGNCDEQLAQGAGNCGCGFPSGSACERLSSAWFEFVDRQVGADARLWLGSLPRRIDLQIGIKQLAVIHGSVSRINRFVFASTSAAIKQQELDLASSDGVICGHCGLPFSQIVNGRLWHNAGVIGMPANDGTPLTWFSILAPGTAGIHVEHRALSYDHRAAAAAMERSGLPPDYRDALSSGMWPSCDVLPYREIREQGNSIEPGSFTWKMDDSSAVSRRHDKEPSAQQAWPLNDRMRRKPLDPLKFKNPVLTARGEPRATVTLKQLNTLWFNTGTLCNITCRNCYIESSPRNDRLSYLAVEDIRPYLDEIERDGWGTREIGFTGGEPFMNPQIIEMLEECLSRGFETLVLTNAMLPMQRHRKKLVDINNRYGTQLTIRVSLDHYSVERHEDERGPDTFALTWDGITWLANNHFKLAVAGRTMWGEDANSERAGYERLFAEHSIPIDARDASALVLFPEMDSMTDVPEITTSCWNTLGRSPDSVMCATSRMVVRRKGEKRPTVLSCTLLPYNEAFEMGTTLREADRAVSLNHPHCAKFCVLGGASCSPVSDESIGQVTHLGVRGA